MDFSALRRILSEASDHIAAHEAGFELEDEQEVNSVEEWGHIPIDQDPQDGGESSIDSFPILEEFIDKLSVEVSKKTDETYRRIMKLFDAYLKLLKLIPRNASIFSMKLPAATPLWIDAFIMYQCDTVLPDGTKNPSPRTYSHAMKIRSALTYGFGRLHARGSKEWDYSDSDGQWTGNPSVSTQVSRYMISLRKRKAAVGDQHALSSRAVTAQTIRRLFKYNEAQDLSTVGTSQATKTGWGNVRKRLLVHAVLVIAFVCLLRLDEALKLKFDDITAHDEDYIEIRLASRKTDPYGEGKPFHLRRFNTDTNNIPLCPILALAKWIKSRDLQSTSGYVFVTPGRSGQAPPAQGGRPISAATWLEYFRNNLLDIGVDPTMYGGHSLRRGGCQWLSSEQRWSITKICAWGGWSQDWNNSHIFKYLYSWNDDPYDPQEDWWAKLNKQARELRRIQHKCPECGRSCDCV